MNTLRKIVQTSTICTKKCWNAKGHTCHCSCAGKNHGVGEANIMLVESVPVVVKPSTKSRINRNLCHHSNAFTFSDGQKICLCNVQHRRHVLCPTDFTKAERSLCRECQAAPVWKGAK